MAVTSPPPITELPTAPVRGDRVTFRSRSESFIAALPDFRDELSALGSNVYSNANETYTNSVSAAAAAETAISAATDAETARDIAQIAGDIQGRWSSLTGSLPIGDSVSHNGRLWTAVTAIADVTLSEPSGSNADWLAVTVPSYSDVSKSTGYTVVPSDDRKIITCTASLTLTFSSASALGSGWSCYVKNTGDANVTLDPDGTETIDGVSSGTVEPGDVFFVRSDGTSLQCEKVAGYKPHYITSSQTWTCPAGVKDPFVQLQAAGGGGGKGSSNFGSGGSGGGYSEGVVSAVAGDTKTITLGAKGAGATSDTTSGGGASPSSFDTDITCGGGYGGTSIYYSLQTSVGSAVGGGLNVPGGLPKIQSTAAYAGAGGDSFLGTGQGLSGTGQQDAAMYGVGGCPGKTGSDAADGGPAICVVWY